MARNQSGAVGENAVLDRRVLVDFARLTAKGIVAALATGVILAALVLLFSDSAGAAGCASVPRALPSGDGAVASAPLMR